MTKHISLGLDLDGTCGDFHSAFRDELDRLGIVSKAVMPVEPPAIYSYAEAGLFSSAETFTEALDAASEAGVYRKMVPYTFMKRTLKSFKDNGGYIKVITSRHENAHDDTVWWLKSVGIDYDELYFTHDKTTVEADCYLDDYSKHIEALRSVGRKAVIFDQPYNQELGGLRAKNWNQVLNLVS